MKWLVKAIFLTSTVMVAPVALSAQDATTSDLIKMATEQGVQQQKITTLEQTVQDTKREIQEFKQDVDTRFNLVDKRFDKIEQLIANSTAEANARFEQLFNRMEGYFNQTETRLKAVEHPWGTNIFSNIVTDPLMICSSAFLYLGTGLAKDHQYASYGVLSLSTMCLAQTLWNAFAPPIQYAILSGGTFIVTAAGSIYALHQNQAAVGSAVKAVSGVAGAVSIGGVLYKAIGLEKKEDSSKGSKN